MNFLFLAWLIICGTLSVFIVLAGIPKIIQLAKLKHLFDDPEDDRKIHEKNIPNIGGVVILIALFTSFLLHPAAFLQSGIQYLLDRKSTRLNSSHVAISYAVFCLKKNTLPMH